MFQAINHLRFSSFVWNWFNCLLFLISIRVHWWHVIQSQRFHFELISLLIFTFIPFHLLSFLWPNDLKQNCMSVIFTTNCNRKKKCFRANSLFISLFVLIISVSFTRSHTSIIDVLQAFFSIDEDSLNERQKKKDEYVCRYPIHFEHPNKEKSWAIAMIHIFKCRWILGIVCLCVSFFCFFSPSNNCTLD